MSIRAALHMLPLLLPVAHTGVSRATPLHLPDPPATTIITLTGQVERTGMTRLGINLSGQTYWDSGQMMRNLVFRNPGFEGGRWQTILRCKQVSQATCTDGNQYTVWPAGFLAGAHYQVISGAAHGATGVVRHSSTAQGGEGVRLTLDPTGPLPAAGDFLLVKADKPGDATAGWWPSVSGKSSLSPERNDLSPHTAGHQALRLDAAAPASTAAVTSYFDSLKDHSFVHLHGPYRLSFRAKGLCASSPCELTVRLERLDLHHGVHTFLRQAVPLSSQWQDYSFDFPTSEPASATGTAGLTFQVTGSTALLDDVSLEPATRSQTNPTAFRDEVVSTLRDLRPGVLRFMDSGTSFGASLDDLLAPPEARRRSGYSTQETVRPDISIGLPEFLQLCQTIGADPWISLPAGFSPQEMTGLLEYLGGPANSPRGQQRAASGQAKPWTEVFTRLHLELGNEVWNQPSFSGAVLPDPTAYGQRAATVFAAARQSPWFQPQRFDLVLGSWAANAWWTGKEIDAAQAVAVHSVDTVTIAPYLLDDFQDASSTEAIFGPLFAQPEASDSRPAGSMAQQLQAATSRPHPVRLAVYETNLGGVTAQVSQSALNTTLPSLGAGLAVVDHMLLMLRDLGITTQCLFALPGYRNHLSQPGGATLDLPLWGSVIDMGGATNRRRPQFLAVQLANQAILPNLLKAVVSGANPTWNQPLSRNDGVSLPDAHQLQAFAFAGNHQRSLILLNLSRTTALPVRLAGAAAPPASVMRHTLQAASLTSSNEQEEEVRIGSSQSPLSPQKTLALPAHSMTVLTWEAP